MTRLFLSCEHGGNDVPPPLQELFAGSGGVLQTHRGWDIGALDLYQKLLPMAYASQCATLSRLCIELNRSEHHPRLFSPYTRDASPVQKARLLAFYRTYRNTFTEKIAACLADGDRVRHIAVHSFTPVLDGQKRTMDIGLLYDPSRAEEQEFCRQWRRSIRQFDPGLVVRMNQPYKGTSDGFPTALRQRLPIGYCGIELEVNQRFALEGRMHGRISAAVQSSLRSTMVLLD